MKRIPDYRNPGSYHREAFFRDATPIVVRILVETPCIRRFKYPLNL